jgi:hypothetical protein
LLADEDDLGFASAVAEHGLRSGFPQRASATVAGCVL